MEDNAPLVDSFQVIYELCMHEYEVRVEQMEQQWREAAEKAFARRHKLMQPASLPWTTTCLAWHPRKWLFALISSLLTLVQQWQQVDQEHQPSCFGLGLITLKLHPLRAVDPFDNQNYIYNQQETQNVHDISRVNENQPRIAILKLVCSDCSARVHGAPFDRDGRCAVNRTLADHEEVEYWRQNA